MYSMIHYWAEATNGKKYEFDSDNFLDIGQEIKDENGQIYQIVDLAEASNISCAEIKEAEFNG